MGQVGSREDSSPEPDLETQVRLAFDNLNAILAAAGCTFDDAVDVTVFMVDPESKFRDNLEGRIRVLGRRAASDTDCGRRDLALWLSVRDQGDREVAGEC